MESARAETVRADRGVLWRRGFPGVVRVNKVTPVSLGCPLSVCNINSTFKKRLGWVFGNPREKERKACIHILLVEIS